jgi:addiction module HigA family antidote
MIHIPLHCAPTHPGAILVEEFLNPLNISQRELADAIRVSYQRINELVNQRRGVTPDTALRLARFFGVSAYFWLNLQMRWDLHQAEQFENEELAEILNYQHLARSG